MGEYLQSWANVSQVRKLRHTGNWWNEYRVVKRSISGFESFKNVNKEIRKDERRTKFRETIFTGFRVVFVEKHKLFIELFLLWVDEICGEKQ